MLLELFDLERSLGIPAREQFDVDLAEWCIDIVSVTAVSLTGADWETPDDVPRAASAILGLAARRLYVNPDLISSEREGEYQVSYSHTATDTNVFTPSEVAALKRIAGKLRQRTGFMIKNFGRGDSQSPRTTYGTYGRWF